MPLTEEKRKQLRMYIKAGIPSNRAMLDKHHNIFNSISKGKSRGQKKRLRELLPEYNKQHSATLKIDQNEINDTDLKNIVDTYGKEETLAILLDCMAKTISESK